MRPLARYYYSYFHTLTNLTLAAKQRQVNIAIIRDDVLAVMVKLEDTSPSITSSLAVTTDQYVP